MCQVSLEVGDVKSLHTDIGRLAEVKVNMSPDMVFSQFRRSDKVKKRPDSSQNEKNQAERYEVSLG